MVEATEGLDQSALYPQKIFKKAKNGYSGQMGAERVTVSKNLKSAFSGY